MSIGDDPTLAAPPDFVGVGCQRSGTSWWFRLIAAHPRVHHPPGSRKEQHYFRRFSETPFGAEEIACYHQTFPRPWGQVRGEWTPCYAHHFWIPPLLREAAPNARLLFMVRDPLERYRSGLSHSWRRIGPVRPGMVALDAAVRGLYANQLDRLWRLFPREQVLILQYERCRLDPVGQLERTFAHLGLEPVLPEHVPVQAPSTKPDLLPAFEAELTEFLRADVERLGRMAPEVDLALWPAFAPTL